MLRDQQLDGAERSGGGRPGEPIERTPVQPGLEHTALRQPAQVPADERESILVGAERTHLGLRVRVEPVAEELTAWSSGQAEGRPLAEVFVIVNERTRLPTENPAG